MYIICFYYKLHALWKPFRCTIVVLHTAGPGPEAGNVNIRENTK